MAVCQLHELFAVKKYCVLVAAEKVVLCDLEFFERATSSSEIGNLLLVSKNKWSSSRFASTTRVRDVVPSSWLTGKISHCYGFQCLGGQMCHPTIEEY